MFSIIIPSWNNLDYLKLCIASIRKNSAHDHEIVVHVNEGADGTLDWVRAEGLRHTRSTANIGVCLAANYLSARATRDWLLFMNDDMVCCPGWDTALVRSMKASPSTLAMYFGTAIEPIQTSNSLQIVLDCGRDPGSFDEARLLAGYAAQKRDDALGRASQPTLVHRTWWHMVGGYSLEFGPGMSSDDDLLMKFWLAGCRHFRVVGDCRVYHFACGTTSRVRRNRGGRTFVMKWGITQAEFKRRFLMTTAGGTSAIPQSEPAVGSTMTGRARRMAYALADYPLGDLNAWDPAPGRHVVIDD